MLGHLDFGVEIEILLAPRSTTFLNTLRAKGWDKTVDSQLRPGEYSGGRHSALQSKNRQAFRSAVATTLYQDGIKTVAVDSSDKATDFSAWTVVDDESVGELPGFWRVELVSRVLSTRGDWQRELNQVFDTLRAECYIKSTNDCSMHVHVSPGQVTFDNAQIRDICKAVIYFDDAITRVMPADRKDNPWAKSNCLPEHPVKGDPDWARCGQSVNPKIKRYYSQVPTATFAPLWKLFDKITWKTVSDTMSDRQGDRARYLSWNFENITKQCGTLEFRRPPCAASSRDANHWVAFALGFVSQAVSTKWDAVETRTRGGSVADLQTFVVQGLKRLPPQCYAALGGIKEDTSAPRRISPEELLRIEALKRQKGKTTSPYAAKVSSRPSTPTSSASSSPSLGRSSPSGWGNR